MNAYADPVFPLVVLLAGGVWLSFIDIRTHRLPNIGVGLLSLILLGYWSIAARTWPNILFALAHTATYLALYIVSKRQLGLGDLKFAFPVGLAVSFFSDNLVLLILAAFIPAALISSLAMLLKRLTSKSRIAFGPFMTFGALLTVVLSA